MSNERTLVELQDWLKQINLVLEPRVPKIVVGNKADLNPELSGENKALLDTYCKENNLPFIKVSAKSGLNIDEAYKKLIESAYLYSFGRRKGKTVPVVIS